jgi:hypothetical protein
MRIFRFLEDPPKVKISVASIGSKALIAGLANRIESDQEMTQVVARLNRIA